MGHNHFLIPYDFYKEHIAQPYSIELEMHLIYEKIMAHKKSKSYISYSRTAIHTPNSRLKE